MVIYLRSRNLVPCFYRVTEHEWKFGKTQNTVDIRAETCTRISITRKKHVTHASFFLLENTARGEKEENLFSNGNGTEWSPIRSVIIQVITKSDDRAAGVRFVYYEYDYRPNWTTRSLITN